MSGKKLLVRAGILAGLILSIASVLNICMTEACTEAHKYSLLGIPMSILGIGFFITAGIVYELCRAKEIFSSLFSLMIFGASGAEIAFILIQKFRIRKWCPLCIGIAAAVYLIATVISFEGIKNITAEIKERRILFMPLLRKAVAVLAVFSIGFFAAYKGMQKSEAGENIPNIFMGNQDSQIEVFIITDWFCPACQKAELEIEKVIPGIGKKAKIIFVDKAIHPETLNYTPYNLSFLTYEKNMYIELRKTLQNLAKKTKEPTPEDVKEAIAPLHVTYKPLSFLSATSGIKFYDSIAREFKVDATPTIVIRDTKTKKFTKLIGVKDITELNIAKAVDEFAH